MRNEPPHLPASARLREHCWVYELDNDRAAIPDFVDAVLDTCFGGIDRAVAMELSLALRELILNAVEHGNLALSYEEKTRALEAGTLEQLLERRRSEEPYKGRRVGVVVRRDREQLTFEVQDGGAGFDWRALPDPMDPTNLLADHGRGVLLARMSVDELSYNEAGTRVTVVKKFDELADELN